MELGSKPHPNWNVRRNSGESEENMTLASLTRPSTASCTKDTALPAPDFKRIACRRLPVI
eukprot:4846978-Pleurochrysis_carterae.AAC.9